MRSVCTPLQNTLHWSKLCPFGNVLLCKDTINWFPVGILSHFMDVEVAGRKTRPCPCQNRLVDNQLHPVAWALAFVKLIAVIAIVSRHAIHICISPAAHRSSRRTGRVRGPWAVQGNCVDRRWSHLYGGTVGRVGVQAHGGCILQFYQFLLGDASTAHFRSGHAM